MNFAIKVKGISRKFSGNEVLKNISFEVQKGEIFGFIGPNGAGKTTTIKIMIGELLADNGEIHLLDCNIRESLDELKPLLGVVPDNQNLYDRLTVRQNLSVFADLYGVVQKRVDEVMEAVNLGEHQNVQAQKLSRGLRQRTLIARAILHKPALLFLDEPTSALDPHSALIIRKLVKDLQAHGTTVLITTHYMDEADTLCDRLAIIHKGEIVAIDTPQSLRFKFGKPTLMAEIAENDQIILKEYPLNSHETAMQLATYMAEGKIRKLHSQEATLEEVFMILTGSQWKESELTK